MRTLSIRQWMLVGMAIFLASAALFYHVAHLLDQRLLQPPAQQTQQQDRTLDVILREAASNSAGWQDPDWQSRFQAMLQPLGAGAVISDASGAEMLRAGHLGRGTRIERREAVSEGGRLVGTVALYIPWRVDPLAPAAATLAVVLALLFVRLQMGRTLVKPLEAMGRAARQIAKGDLDFALPQSRVKEVAEVRAAFEAMGEGLKASIIRQAELEEERRFFIAAIAHDLRTPLFALRGALVGLEQGIAASPEKAARYVALCRQKSDQLDRLVADLFAYTRVEYLEQTLVPERLDFGTLIERAVEDLKSRAREKNIRLSLTGPGEACPIEGDAHLLERVLENLLDNALRHTPAGGAIEVEWGRTPDRLTFRVADTGPGIAGRDLPHLFEPLYRGEMSRNRQTGGAGLGLAIARRILRAHGGDLLAVNRSGGGAEFSGWLAAPEVAPHEPEPVAVASP